MCHCVLAAIKSTLLMIIYQIVNVLMQWYLGLLIRNGNYLIQLSIWHYCLVWDYRVIFVVRPKIILSYHLSCVCRQKMVKAFIEYLFIVFGLEAKQAGVCECWAWIWGWRWTFDPLLGVNTPGMNEPSAVLWNVLKLVRPPQRPPRDRDKRDDEIFA